MSDPAAVEQHTEAHHPSPREYVNIAIILLLVTIVEVAIVYIEALDAVVVPLLVFLGVTKFALVVLWYMHLKFDSRLFMRLFVTGVLLAIAVFFIVLATFVFRGGPAPAVGG